MLNKTILFCCAGLLSGSLMAAVLQDVAPQTKPPQDIDIDTPDAVILDGLNTEKAFALKRPSVRLTFEVDGVDSEIQVSFKDGIPTLTGEVANEQQRRSVIDAFKAFYQSDALNDQLKVGPSRNNSSRNN